MIYARWCFLCSVKNNAYMVTLSLHSYFKPILSISGYISKCGSQLCQLANDLFKFGTTLALTSVPKYSL